MIASRNIQDEAVDEATQLEGNYSSTLEVLQLKNYIESGDVGNAVQLKSFVELGGVGSSVDRSETEQGEEEYEQQAGSQKSSSKSILIMFKI